MRLKKAWILAISSLLTAGLTGCAKSPPGPVPLRGPQHMEEYLAGAAAWKLWYEDDPVQFWEFKQDGSFSVWIEGDSKQDLNSLLGAPIPAGATRLTGKWEATTTQLKLSEVITASGETVKFFSLDLKWMDGKLRIEIGGHHYIREMQ